MSHAPLHDALEELVADGTVFYQRLRTFHWNVRGPHFFELHAKFEELYNKWNLTIDTLAERLLTLGGKTPPTLAAMIARSSLEEIAELPDGPGMVRQLAADLETFNGKVGSASEASEKAGDAITMAVLDTLREDIQKDQWMLRAWLD